MLPVLRGSRLADRRYTSGGHTVEDADALLPDLLEFAARARTGPELVDFLTPRLGADASRMWWALPTFAPLNRVPSGEPWSFTAASSSFRAAPGAPRPPSESVARAWLLERYLAGFGPASGRDFAQFSLLRGAAVRDALTAFLDQRDPRVYRRYNHWWDKDLPRAEVRLLGRWTRATTNIPGSRVSPGRGSYVPTGPERTAWGMGDGDTRP